MKWGRLFQRPHRSARQITRDVDDELQFHLAAREEALVATGTPRGEARRQALRDFGDIEDARTYLRVMDRRTETARRRRDIMGSAWQDLTYALRSFRSAPAFAITAALTLALGIGANTAIFSVVNGILLRPLPFPEPQQLYRVWSVSRSSNRFDAPVSAMDLDDWRAQRKDIADLGGSFYQANGSGIDMVNDAGEPMRLSAVFVTPGFFSTLGIPPVLGRLPREQELVRGGPDRVVLLGDGFWRRQFGGSSSVLGTSLRLGGEPYDVIGVLPPSFAFPVPGVDVYIPFSTIPDDGIPRLRPVRILDVVARARPGVTAARVETELAGITARLAQQFPENAAWDGARITPLQDAMTGNVRTGLLVLLSAVAFVLLIACVNVASLQLARSAVREREIAVRSALGAGRRRIVRQLLTESLLLATIGGLLGLALARIGVPGIVALSAGQLPRGADVRIDGAVLAFTVGLSFLTGLVFGVVPALRATGDDLQRRLHSGGRGTAGQAHARLRSGLVVGEVALAMVLVIGGGLMLRSFRILSDVDPGFRSDHLLAVNLTLSTERHGDAFRLVYEQILDQVRALPGVLAAGAAKDVPFRGGGEGIGFTLPGMTVPAGEDPPIAAMVNISDGYFHAIGARMLAGREFARSDRGDAPLVVVVNEAFANRWFPGQDAVGQHLVFGRALRVPIIGVVHDIRQTELATPAEPTVYLHQLQNGRTRMNLVVRTHGPPLQLAAAVRAAIHDVDPLQPVTAVFTMDDAISDALARPRLMTVLLGTFGAFGLLLGALGLYGVLAYLVGQRRREIGVRLALGAQRTQVLSMVVRHGLSLTARGVIIGSVAALALGRFLAAVLYGVAPSDPATFVFVAAILFVVAGVACLLPARRAARVDVTMALRDE